MLLKETGLPSKKTAQSAICLSFILTYLHFVPTKELFYGPISIAFF